MNRANRTILTIHRVSGTLIAVFFFMWFSTGLILVYKGFPRLDEHKALMLEHPLPASNPLPDSLPAGLNSLVISSSRGKTLVEWRAKDGGVISPDGSPLGGVTFEMAEKEACKWVNAPVSRADTLHERDQWIMYSRYLDELPIYKFYFNDPEGSQVYVSSKSGEVLLTTDRDSRFWAWMGAIPHKLYFPFLRKDVGRWKLWLLIGSSFCMLASLSGVYAGLYLWIRKRNKTGVWRNPFSKPLMRWHFTLGLIFAIPLVAWSLSGMFAMRKVPKWLVPVEGVENVTFTKLWGRGMMPLEAYALPYSSIISTYPSARTLTYGRAGDIPLINVVTPDSTLTLDARYDRPSPLHITMDEAKEAVRNLFGDNVRLASEVLTEYDHHYFSIRGSSPLPVYKITVDNADKSLLYINPATGRVTYLNRNREARTILFGALHYLNWPLFAGHPGLWKVCMWIACCFGSVFCFISVCLAVKYVKRILRSLKKKNITAK